MSEVENLGGAVSQNEQSGAETDNQKTQSPNLGAIRKDGQREVITALSKELGIEFGNKQEVINYVKELVSSRNSGGSEQPKAKSETSKSNNELAELRQMIQSLHSTIAEKEQVVRKTSLQSQIKEIAVKSGFDPQYLDIASGLFEQQISFDEDGSFYVKSKDGGVKLDSNGDPFTLDKLAQEILKNRPKLAVEEPRTGTGTKFGFSTTRVSEEMPDAAADPEGWKAWKQAHGVGVKGAKNTNVTVSGRRF